MIDTTGLIPIAITLVAGALCNTAIIAAMFGGMRKMVNDHEKDIGTLQNRTQNISIVLAQMAAVTQSVAVKAHNPHVPDSMNRVFLSIADRIRNIDRESTE